MAATTQDYYNTPSTWGNYQFMTLEELVNNFMMSGDDGDYTSLAPRYKVLFQARRAFRELYLDVMQEDKGIKLSLNPTLNVALPPDYVNWKRVSWVGEDGLLRPMAQNTSMNITPGYLQDDNYEILFDDNGCALKDSSGGVGIGGGRPSNSIVAQSYRFACDPFNPNKNFSNDYPNGTFRIDKNNGIIQFGSEVFGADIVLEYVSDGLYTGCEGRPESQLRIHKFCETAVYDYIYWKLIERSMKAPANEKARAEKSWWNSRRLAKRKVSTLRKEDLLQVFKGSNKWIKGV